MVLKPTMSGVGDEAAKYPFVVIALSSLEGISVIGTYHMTELLNDAHSSAGSSVASGPKNSSGRSRTGFARNTASNLSAL